MIKFKIEKEQPDLFNPDKELALVVSTENLIDGHKTKMRVLPDNIDRYRDKVTRDELINTVTRMVNSRYTAYKFAASTAPQYKWESAKYLLSKIPTLNKFKNVFGVCNYIKMHLRHHLVAITPGESSRFYSAYIQKLELLIPYINQQISAYQRGQMEDHSKEKMTNS